VTFLQQVSRNFFVYFFFIVFYWSSKFLYCRRRGEV
jgi:hypothetical protein